MKSFKIAAMTPVLFATFVSIAAAQGPSDPGPVMAGAITASQKGGMVTMHLENNMDVAPIKGAPFCATVTTEHTQNFADGNRIHTSENATLCRDSAGRIRREAGLNLLGAGPQPSTPRLITIEDPVAGARYMLDPVNKIAHKSNFSARGGAGHTTADFPNQGQRMMIYQSSGGPGPQSLSTNVFFAKKIGSEGDEPAPASESLGDQTFNGIHATGTRITTTIPAGKMGNDKPINVTSERWYSNELKAPVMTRHDDPWAGELKTELTTVNTAEPDASLFVVPSDYKVVDDQDGPITVRVLGSGPSDPPSQ